MSADFQASIEANERSVKIGWNAAIDSAVRVASEGVNGQGYPYDSLHHHCQLMPFCLDGCIHDNREITDQPHTGRQPWLRGK